MKITLSKTIPFSPPMRVDVTASTDRGYFSVMAEFWRENKKGKLVPVVCGNPDSIVRQHFPEVAPLLPLQLSDAETGEPLHALENGWYWFVYGPEHKLRDHLRTSTYPLPGITKKIFSDFLDSQRLRWTEEAFAGRELIQQLIERNK